MEATEIKRKSGTFHKSSSKKYKKSTSLEEAEISSGQFNSAESKDSLARQIFNIILDDWMYSYGIMYNEDDYAVLFDLLKKSVEEESSLRFFIPGFPCKSCNTKKKVLGTLPDFAEVLAIRSLTKTLRKIEAIYVKGAKMTILSDYHTFDQYIGVEEETYQTYHEALKHLVNDAGASDVIELISLSSFPEFQNVPGPEASKKLRDEYGGTLVLQNFEECLRNDRMMLEKYKKLKKFMQFDQSHRLPGSPRANKTRSFIKRIARGMLAQGIALDNFLKHYIIRRKFIRLSVHNHHPSTGKFAIDMFKEHQCSGGILRTPWHHAVVFDSASAEFMINHRQGVEKVECGDSSLVTVMYKGEPWLLLRVYFDSQVKAGFTAMPSFHVSMVRGSCGLVVECKTDSGKPIPTSVFQEQSLTSLVKEFGLVVMRGFKQFGSEEEIVEFYKTKAKYGIVKWKFGFVHKVTPNKEIPGYVNSNGGLPIHFDLTAPPKYMQISQEEHSYEEFVVREFLLYCKDIGMKGQGATVFVDTRGAVLSINGKLATKWKQTTIAYETELNSKPERNKEESNQKAKNESYFGGIGNVYTYPLVIRCPWTGSDVLRWWQTWTAEKNPQSEQHNWSFIKSSPCKEKQTIQELEKEIEKVAYDERFFFQHSYEVGDQVYVNNYTMLHGRTGFTDTRELWRLQAVPPSGNVPKYFKNNFF